MTTSRLRLVALFAGFEIALGGLFATLATRHVTAPLRAQPDGALALGGHGARGAIEFVLRNPDRLLDTLVLLATLVAGYAALSLPFAGFLPAVLGARDPLRIREALRASLHATWVAAVAQCASVMLYAVAGVLAWASIRGAIPTKVTHLDRRLADALFLARLVPALLVVLAARVLDDVVVSASALGASDIGTAAKRAWLRIASEPWKLPASYIAAIAVSTGLLVVAVVLSPASDHAIGAAGIVVFVAQQLFAFARVAVRAWWFGRITLPWRRETTTESPTRDA